MAGICGCSLGAGPEAQALDGKAREAPSPGLRLRDTAGPAGRGRWSRWPGVRRARRSFHTSLLGATDRLSSRLGSPVKITVSSFLTTADPAKRKLPSPPKCALAGSTCPRHRPRLRLEGASPQVPRAGRRAGRRVDGLRAASPLCSVLTTDPVCGVGPGIRVTAGPVAAHPEAQPLTVPSEGVRGTPHVSGALQLTSTRGTRRGGGRLWRVGQGGAPPALASSVGPVVGHLHPGLSAGL